MLLSSPTKRLSHPRTLSFYSYKLALPPPQGCFHTTGRYITAIPEVQCIDPEVCSEEQYEW